jgi:predicted nucleic acid-binding protein
MLLIDTGYLLAFLDPHDALHARARRWAGCLTEPLLVTEYVLWETVNACSKPVNRPRVHALLSGLRTIAEVTAASPALFEAGLKLHAERPDKEWSLTDCISFVVMKQRGLTQALAHDQHYEQAGFGALLRRDPP